MRFRFGPALQFAAALALAAAFAPTCAARQGGTARTPRPDSTQRELQRTLERELLFKQMENAMSRPAPPRPTRDLSFAQISEDFTRLQIVNHDLARAVAAGGELDFKMVADSTAEIKKRAGRLKDNLILPGEVEERPKVPPGIEAGQLKAALAELDRLVYSFVHNPGFQSVKVVDAEWSARARNDLEGIIELSGRLKKSSEQLHRAAQKSH
ncbi:MAG TPA: hypothetical protein VJ866_02925 [Pyrinomonadaceae bacterium]|nr:hypothetical protein [Pyrinomonadaceae bacterium]